MLRTNSKLKNNLFIVSHLNNLLGISERAYALRDTDTLSRASAALSKHPMGGWASRYYSALALNRTWENRTRAGLILESVAEYAPPFYRGRALLARGGNAFDLGDLSTAEKFYHETLRFDRADSFASLAANKMLAVIQSQEGNHRGAIGRLESLLPAAKACRNPIIYYEYMNALAVESACTGNHGAARAYIEPCLNSSFAFAYPEWSDTALEIPHASRSRIFAPAFTPDRIASVRSNAIRSLMAKVTDLDKWRKKPDDEPRLPSEAQLRLGNFVLKHADLTVEECDLITELARLLSKKHPSFETLKDIAEYAEKVIEEENE